MIMQRLLIAVRLGSLRGAIALLAFSGCTIPPDTNNATNAVVRKAEGQIPHSLVAEHLDLRRRLEDARNSGGGTAHGAKAVADQLEPHFAKEEDFALPPLMMLGSLSQGRTMGDAQAMIERSERLKVELPQMLTEHKAIAVALDRLEATAHKENKPAVVEFCERMRLHAQGEEEILYPAAILIGDHLKLGRQP